MTPIGRHSLLAAAVATMVAIAPAAFAHGGRFTQPPPNIVPPGTPTTPHMPPPTSPQPIPPPTGGPVTPGSGLGPRTPGELRGRGRALSQSTDWRDWWDANADALRADRPRRIQLTPDNPLAGIGGGSAPTTSDLPTRKAVATSVLPTLRDVLATTVASDPDTLAAATLALAKATDDPADALRIIGWLGDAQRPDMAREAAALALGLLRRTKPTPAFDGRFYDRMRTVLFDVVDDRRQAKRTRCFAALALGLLGDQAVNEHDAFAKDGRLAIRGLWLRIDHPATDDETAVALLVGLSLQNPSGVPAAVRAGLSRLATTGDAGRRRRGSVARAHALLALARIGDGEGVIGLATSIVKSSGNDPHVRRSAVLALGLLAPRLDGPARESLARVLIDHARSGEPNTTGLSMISAARLLASEFEGGLVSGGALAMADTISDAADHATFAVRPFAALAIGLLVRPAGKAFDDQRFVDMRERALVRLRATYADDGEDPTVRGAFAIALGIAGDGRARPLLEAQVLERKGSPDLAAFSCAGLGLLSDLPESSRRALRAAMADRSYDGLRREAARALGLAGDAKAVPALLAELETDASDHILARSVIALGAIRDASAIAPLCALARKKGLSDASRALACAGLGLLSDFELVPSLSRLGIDSNYLARTDALDEALSLL